LASLQIIRKLTAAIATRVKALEIDKGYINDPAANYYYGLSKFAFRKILPMQRWGFDIVTSSSEFAVRFANLN